LKHALREAGIPTLPSPSHIVPVVIGNAAKTKQVCDCLLRDYGIYVQPINYPTVPRGTERLRLTPGPRHDAALIGELVRALSEVWGRFGLGRQQVVVRQDFALPSTRIYSGASPAQNK
jgi:5-aminolevulinate synthase